MSVNGNVIFPPVSMADVRTSLSRTDKRLRDLCQSNAVNRWARYKPIAMRGKGRLTEDALISAKYGLSPSSMEKVPKVLYPTYVDGSATIGDDGYSWDEISAEWREWEYRMPDGGEQSPYRLTDFAPSVGGPVWGYYHDTPPPMDGFAQFSVTLAELSSIANDESITATAGSDADIYNMVVSKTTGLYTNFRARFGDASWQQINNASTYTIPLTSLLAGIYSGNEDYRIGLVIYLPHTNHAHLIVSAATFREVYGAYQSKSVQMSAPTLCSNQYLCKEIADYFASNPKIRTVAFRALPVLVKNAYFTRIGRMQSSTPYLSVTADNSTVFYCAPSFVSSIPVIIRRSAETTIYDKYSMTAIANGNYAHFGGGVSWGRIPINDVKVSYIGSRLASDETVYFKAEIVYVSSFKGSTPVGSTITQRGSVTFAEGSVAGDSRTIIAYPGATVTNYELSYEEIL